MQLKRASNGTSIVLGEELGSGGEGAVYRVADVPDLVAKIYFEPPGPGKSAKLAAMTRLAPPELLRIAAWPIDLLLDESDAVRGFLMQLVSSREDAHQLYSPRSRRRAFPDADFRFIVHAAANVARAFAQLHALGHVIGDVNHGNALIGRDATVVLIDCDSFQVKDGETTFSCDVGVPLFTPCELQGQNFRGLSRNAGHDAFGLAVLLFHFLYAGRHPYAGVFADGEMPIEQAIAESRFAYGPGAAARQMSAPPGTLALNAFGAPIAALFERAFAVPGMAARPTAVEWVETLQLLEDDLVTCAVSSDHDHPKAAACCWCELESRSSISLFGRNSRRVEPYFDAAELERLWNAITAVSPPPETGVVLRDLHALIVQKAQGDKGGSRIGCTIVCFGFALVSFPSLGFKSFVAIAGAALVVNIFMMYRESNAGQIEEDLVRDTERRISAQPFLSELAELEGKRRRLKEIQENPSAIVAQTLATREALERQRYLGTHFLASSGGPDLRAGERAVLLSYGVASAADVLRERSQLHHSLSYAKVRELIQWAETCGYEFEFNPEADHDVHAQRAVDLALRAEMAKLMDDLRVAAASLERHRDEIQERREAVEYELSKGNTSV